MAPNTKHHLFLGIPSWTCGPEIPQSLASLVNYEHILRSTPNRREKQKTAQHSSSSFSDDRVVVHAAQQ